MTDPNSISTRVLDLADEFLDRYRKGQRPPLAEYTQRYPELAEEIREVFSAMAMMERIALADESLEGAAGSAVAPPPPRFHQLGDYRILREIGRGGMGVVFEAEQVSLGRQVALKVLPERLIRDPKQRIRFEREAKAAARLHHTNIVPVFGVGEDDGTPYYAMQFIPGLGLDQVLEELKRQRQLAGLGLPHDQDAPTKPGGLVTAADVARSLLEGRFQTSVRPSPSDEAELANATTAEAGAARAERSEPDPVEPASLSTSATLLGLGSGSESRSPGSSRANSYWKGIARLGFQVADALAYAHSQGILHRDVKPSNLLLDARGTVWVADFGLAKIDDQQGLTHTGDILGTLRYMPPEAFEGRHDGRGDVYSLGLSLYEMLAFRPAFDEVERGRLVRQVTSGEPPRLRSINPEVPRDLETVIHKAIDRDPSHRYPTANALGEDLRRYFDGDSILARRSAPWERAAKWVRRRPALASMIGAVQVLLVTMLVTVAWSYSNVRDALKVAESRRTDALKAAALESSARSEAETARNAALAETARALLSETRALRLSREAGWRAEALGNLARLARLDTPARDLYRLRTEAVACLGEPDARPLVDVRLSHRPVWEVEFRPDGKVLAVNDLVRPQVRLWDLETRRVVREVPKVNGRSPFAFRPDGSCLAMGAEGNRVVFEPMAEGVKVPPPLVGPKTPLALAFDRLGRRIAVAWGQVQPSMDHAPTRVDQVVVYEVESGVVLRTIPGPFAVPNYTAPLAFRPDGSAVSTVGPNHAVQLWKVPGNDPPTTLGHHLSQVLRMAFSPDGGSLATCGRTPDPVVKVWDVALGRERLAIHGHSANVWGVAFSPDGSTLASTGNDLTLRFWDPRDGHELLTAPTGTEGICLSIAFAPEGRRVAVSGNSVRIVDLEGFQTRKTLAGHDNIVSDLAFRPGHEELVSGAIDRHLIVWGRNRRSKRILANSREYPEKLAYDPRGAWLVAGPNVEGSSPSELAAGLADLRIVTPDLIGPETRLKGAQATTTALAVDPSGRWVASGHANGDVMTWDVEARQARCRLSLGQKVVMVGFRPGPPQGPPTLLAVAEGGQALLTDLIGLDPRLSTIPGHPDATALEPGGDHLAVGLPDGSIELRRLPDLVSTARTASGHDRGRFQMAHDPEGRLLASGYSDRKVVVRDARTLQPLFELAAPMAIIYGLTFSADGTTLAFSGTSNTITVWDFAQVRTGLQALGLGWTFAPTAPAPALTPSTDRRDWTIPSEPIAREIVIPTESLESVAGPNAPVATYQKTLKEFQRQASALAGTSEMMPEEATLLRVVGCLFLLSGDRPGFDRHAAFFLGRLEARPCAKPRAPC